MVSIVLMIAIGMIAGFSLALADFGSAVAALLGGILFTLIWIGIKLDMKNINTKR